MPYGMMYLQRKVLDGDRVLGIKSLQGYPVMSMTHPSTKAELRDFHMIDSNLKVGFLEANKNAEKNRQKHNMGLWGQFKAAFGAEAKEVPKIYQKHPFRHDLPKVKDVDFIHYDQAEGIAILCQQETLLFFQVTWSNIEFLGGFKMKFGTQYCSKVRNIVVK
jgi:hypothetical protein